MGWSIALSKPKISLWRNMIPRSALYVGRVRHHRKAPHPHSLSYGTYQLLLDIEAIDRAASRSRWFSHNGFNLFSFYDQDHGPQQAEARSGSLAARIRLLLESNDLYTDSDRLFLMAMPRFLGFVFNPISLYFHYSHKGKLLNILYEVNNTFGDRHTYILTVTHDEDDGIKDQSSRKRLHVSPFMDMEMRYRFQIENPAKDFSLRILLLEEDRLMLTADLDLCRQEINDLALIKRAFFMPFMTIGVVLAIHWEALLIWLKGNSYRDKPQTIKSSVSKA